MLLDLLLAFGLIAYYTLKGLWYVLRYFYRKLTKNQRKAPSLLRYDKRTNDLEVLE